MNLEMCYECDQPTGKAGVLDDSLFLWGNPYCEQCYHDIMSELPGEVETLRHDNKHLLNIIEELNNELELYK